MEIYVLYIMLHPQSSWIVMKIIEYFQNSAVSFQVMAIEKKKKKLFYNSANVTLHYRNLTNYLLLSHLVKDTLKNHA